MPDTEQNSTGTRSTALMLSVHHWLETRWQFVQRALLFPS